MALSLENERGELRPGDRALLQVLYAPEKPALWLALAVRSLGSGLGAIFNLKLILMLGVFASLIWAAWLFLLFPVARGFARCVALKPDDPIDPVRRLLFFTALTGFAFAVQRSLADGMREPGGAWTAPAQLWLGVVAVSVLDRLTFGPVRPLLEPDKPHPLGARSARSGRNEGRGRLGRRRLS